MCYLGVRQIIVLTVGVNRALMNKYLIALIFFFAVLTNTSSQELSYQKYSVKDGLSQTQVMDIKFDRKGFVWVLTKRGLSRFDGYGFTNYSFDDGLPDGIIGTICIDRNDTLWTLSMSGISKFDGEKFVFYPMSETKNISVGRFLISYNDTLWFVKKTPEEHFLIAFKNGKYYQHKFHFNTKRLGESYENERGIFLFGENTIHKYVNGSFEKVPRDESDISYKVIREGGINDTLEVECGEKDKLFKGLPNRLITPEYLLRRGKYLYLCNSDRGATRILWDKEWLNQIKMDHQGTLWIGSEGGLYRYYSDAFLNFTSANGLNKNIWSVVEDSSGNIWFVSFTNGLQEYDGTHFRDRNEIFRVRNEPLYMKARLLSNGDIFFPSNSGVIRWNGKHFSDVKWAKGQTEMVYENPKTKEILIGSVKGLIVNKNGKVKVFKELSVDNRGYVMGISLDKKGFYWLMTNKGIAKFDGKKISILKDPPLRSGMATDVDSTGNIWMGGFEGLFYYSYSNDKFTHVVPGDDNQMVKFVKVMDKNRVLIGRMKDLVIIYLNKLYSGDTQYYKIINRSYGYLGYDPRQNGILKDSKGYYWINYADGVIRFDDRKLKPDTIPPYLHIMSLYTLNDSNKWQAERRFRLSVKAHVDTVILGHNENNLRVYFTGISTRCPEGVVYKYRLLGQDDKWTTPDQKRYAEFQDVKPGRYILEVKSANADGAWTEKPARLVIKIIPAYWQTLSFMIALYLLLGILGGVIVFLYLKRKERQREIQRKEQDKYTRIQINQLISQFDPHFTFNVVSVIGTNILMGEKEKAYDYLVNLSELLRSALNDHEVFTKTIEEEIGFLHNYCKTQQLVLGDKLTYDIEVDPEVNMNIKVPKLLIQNFVENAIKHGIAPKEEGGHVHIKLFRDNSHLVAVIEDTGIGRAAAQELDAEGTHNGHKITSELFRLINKVSKEKIEYEIIDLYDDDGKPAGTRVIIKFPVH